MNSAIFSAYLNVLKKYFSFEGRASRSELIYWHIANFAILLIFVYGLRATIFDISEKGLFQLGLCFFVLTFIIPTWMLWIRRLHDLNRTGFFALLLPLPAIGFILKLILVFYPGNNETNDYGTIAYKYKLGQTDWAMIIALLGYFAIAFITQG